SIKVIKIRNAREEFTLKKIQNEWRITEPVYTQADQSTVKSMLSSLLSATKENVFTVDRQERMNYGFGPTQIFLQLETAEGVTDSIWFGDKTPVGAQVFAHRNDSTVFTVNQSIKTGFQKKLFDLRDKSILQFTQSDVRGVRIKRPGEDLQFEKTGAGKWTLVNINRPADAGKVSGILSRLSNNRAKAFVDEEGKNLQDYGLKNPPYEVELTLGPQQGQKTLFLSKEVDNKFYARDESRKPVFEVDSFLVSEIAKPVKEYRSTDFADFDRDEVNRIEISYGDTLLTLQKQGENQWMLPDSGGRTVKSSDVSTLLSDLDFTVISDFVKDGSYNPRTYGLDNPVLHISLFRDSQLLLEAKFGSIKGEKVYAATNQNDSVYLISKDKLNDFRLKPQEILEAPADTTKPAA
ncbi:MAG: DUF4340 domain-containing protein, partial [Calditrichia bacterium]